MGTWPGFGCKQKGFPGQSSLYINRLKRYHSPGIPKRNAEFVELNNDKWIETIPIHLAAILVDYPSQGSTDRPPGQFVPRWSPLRIPWSATR